MPVPVPIHTHALARLDVASVSPDVENVMTGVDWANCDPSTVRPGPARADGCTVAVDAPKRNTRHVPAAVVVAARYSSHCSPEATVAMMLFEKSRT